MIDIGFTFGIAIYGMIWFVTLFTVLPFGVVTQDEAGDVEPGTPPQPRQRPATRRPAARRPAPRRGPATRPGIVRFRKPVSMRPARQR